jgi:hypothetical protein
VGTDPLKATPKNVKLPIILNNQLNLNDRQTIAFLAITITFFPDPFGAFLDNPNLLLFTMNTYLTIDVWRHEHDTTNLMATYVIIIHRHRHLLNILFVLMVL